MVLVHKKLCQTKMSLFGKKLKKHFFTFIIWGKLENEARLKKLFKDFSIHKIIFPNTIPNMLLH
jgi:hypothetical protein